MKLLERLRFEHFLVAGSVAALLAGGLLFGQRPPRPGEEEEEIEAGMSRAVAKSGSKALASLLRSLGGRVVRLERRLDLVTSDLGVVLSAATPRLSDRDFTKDEENKSASEQVFDREETRGLLRWISGGGTFIWMPRRGHGEALLKELGLEWAEHPAREGVTRVSFDLSPVRRDLGNAYGMEVGSSVRLRRLSSSSVAPVPLAEDGTGWVAAFCRIGKGRAIVFSEPRAARNDALTGADHDALLAHLILGCAGRRTIAFDEYHHGSSAGQGALAYVMDTPVGGVLIHLLVLGLLILLGTGRRLGPALIVHEERRRRPREFIEAFARLCRASRNAGLAVELALAGTLDSLQRRFGGSDPVTVEREAVRRGVKAGEAASVLAGARKASKLKPSAHEMLHWIRKLETIRRTLTDRKER